MRRHFQLQHPVVVESIDPRHWCLQLRVEQVELAAFCCELMLLQFGMVERLSLLGDRPRKLTVVCHAEHRSVAEVESEAVRLTLCRRDLEAVLGFLLAWYRDGTSSVSHLDIELAPDAAAGIDRTLLVEAGESRPPMPADEAIRLLGKSE